MNIAALIQKKHIETWNHLHNTEKAFSKIGSFTEMGTKSPPLARAPESLVVNKGIAASNKGTTTRSKT